MPTLINLKCLLQHRTEPELDHILMDQILQQICKIILSASSKTMGLKPLTFLIYKTKLKTNSFSNKNKLHART